MESVDHIRPHGALPGRWRWWPLLGLAVLGAGCAGLDVPQPGSHAPSTQKTMRAVRHWDVLAQDMATRIAEKTRDWPAGAHPIYVTSRADTRFSQGFRKLLINHLVDQGVTVAIEPTAVQLVVDAQVVQHLEPATSVLHFVPLASGVSVARDGVHFHGAQSFYPAANGNAAKDSDIKAGAAPAAERGVVIASGSAFGAAVAAASAVPVPPAPPIRKAPAAAETPVEYPPLGTPTRSEVLVTASLESGGRYLAGTSDVYSLTHDDALLYLPAEPRLPGPPTPSIKTWRVVSP
ncbi:MAG: hypothetical protein Q8N13_15160 [Acidovorax sp.]|nr:hypothetical protein [Acidovorax sp.]MDP3229302.1 hypothetical protein [Acidovorax sp.]